ncbi:putative Fis family transcriptional regulator [Candidatus Hydrogenisulfobacillus filiaventi]|uniref:Putative Fis family transcriptional regulator n=1 Tax=Candidatus Hydrogenisulfobacillus filiaventi TaxID=2707344 RepID=A0A6F8ZKM9_9FIRM|nr:sigma 54-interacting transcriptional regulator [Bacillota bacterium]CAB1130226.1 putative Fis family transcriptional regulator [Candidatus Hydrogenisulfobacillus filiaventi]
MAISNRRVLETLLDNTSEGVHVIDRHGRTVLFNRVAAEREGLLASEVIGRHVLEVYPSLTEETSTLLKVLRTRRAFLNQRQSFTNYKGRTITTVNSTYPIFDGGTLAGAMEISRDITEVLTLSRQLAAGGQPEPARERAAAPAEARFWPDLDLLRPRSWEDLVVGEDAAYQEAVHLARQAAAGDAPVLLAGEPGTGKETLAALIHAAGPRAAAPFTVLPASLSETEAHSALLGDGPGQGLLVRPAGGSVLLKQVEEAAPRIQGLLAAALARSQVWRTGGAAEAITVRLMATTAAPGGARAGTLRQDLYDRLAAVEIHLPSLRHRLQDLPALTAWALGRWSRHYGRTLSLSPAALDRMAAYAWPGNLRELFRVLAQAVATSLGGRVEEGDLPTWLGRVPRADGGEWNLRRRLRQHELELISQALARTGGNISEAARLLGVPRQTLQYRLRQGH